MVWALALWVIGCTADDDDDPSGDQLDYTTDPTIVTTSPLFPLTRAVAATLTAPGRLEITAIDALGETLSWTSGVGTEHELPLVGLHADGAWDVTVTAVGEEGGSTDPVALTTTTGPLPSPMPTIEVHTSVPESMEPGLTIVPIYATNEVSYIALVDASGRIVWLFGDGGWTEKFTEIRLLPSGNLLALNDNDILEIDWKRIIGRWKSEASTAELGIVTGLRDYHHDVLWSSRDTIVVLSKSTFDVDDFPRDDLYQNPEITGPSTLADDLIVEMDPADGTVIQEWSVTSMLDLERIGYESLNRDDGAYEWAHVNAIDEDVANSRWVVSARNQDAVFAVDQETGAVDWILANHDNWHAPYTDLLLEPVGEDFLWPYHQHAAKYDPATGRVLMFDNGNYRASPFTGQEPLDNTEAFSRVVEYTVDEVARTVTQNWELRLDPFVFSRAMGDADWLPNGNVLGDFAYIEWQGGQDNDLDLGIGSNLVRLVEFAPSTDTVVWDIEFWDPLTEDPSDWQAYRAQRIPRPFAAAE
jgi:arylsulfate sulfotransferase